MAGAKDAAPGSPTGASAVSSAGDQAEWAAHHGAHNPTPATGEVPPPVAPPVQPGTVRAQAPEPTPAHTDPAPSSKDIGGQQAYGAAQAGRDVVTFVKLLNGGEVTLDEAAEEGTLFRVRYHGEGDKPVRRTAWVTADGRWITTNRVDIETRTRHLEQFDTWTRCLRDKGFRAYLDPTQDKSKAQTQELGPMVSRLAVDCSGARQKLCNQLGFSAFPTLVWQGKSEVGVRKRAWIQSKLGCPLQLSAKLSAPPKVDLQQLGQRVLKLHEVATDQPVDLISVRRSGPVYTVVLARGRQRPTHIALTISGDGAYLLQSPIDRIAQTRLLRRNRRFVGCLVRQKTKLFVDSREPKTLRWLAATAPNAGGVVIDCSSIRGKSICKDAGVTKLPAAARGDLKLGPTISVEDLEALSGCKR